MKMKLLKLLFGMLWLQGGLNLAMLQAQGDQILDGIGETDLIARYKLNENVKDASRNNLHGQMHGSGYHMIEDAQFGKVISLTSEDDAYISFPVETVMGEASLSICGWIYLMSDKTGQVLFDFGENQQSRIKLVLSNTNGHAVFRAQVHAEEKEYALRSNTIILNEWNHVALVLNIPAKKISFYVNGKPNAEVDPAELNIKQMFNQISAGENRMYIGKSIDSELTTLHARLYDFRLYRIPLDENQVTTIYADALNKENVNTQANGASKDELHFFPATTPQLYNAYLKSVPDIEVTTEVGYLPRLPRFLNGVYNPQIKGPKVRVIWPAPTDNNEVLKPGSYTLTGIIPGSEIQPKVTITVLDNQAPETPKQMVEAFDLNQVQLTSDIHQHTSKFVENRDKFMTGLDHTNPDDFLYMFRNAFGQKQPNGAKPLGVWDSQETKLRGHATGHYLSALAQAYSSAGYDTALQARFAKKMNYMVNTLFALAQLSGKPNTPGGASNPDPMAVPPGPGKTSFDSDLSETGIRTDYWNWGHGYISAYPPDQFIMLENGALYGHDSTRIWAPYYTLHKILAGLMDVYEVSANEKALEIVKGMGDWVNARLSRLSTDTLTSMWNRYIAGEFGGMNEAMARLSRLTNDRRYLETARLFDNITLFYGDAQHSHGLAKNVDLFRGLHANQHIPQIMGALEIYRDAADRPEYYRIAENFWNKATGDYMYSIGGVAGARNPTNAECFTAQPATLYANGFSSGGQNETCATYNLLKLSRNLFFYNQNAALMDYYERGLYNHILASVAKDNAANTYHVPLNAGAEKYFSNADMHGFTCCNGTALESNTKLQNSIYFKSVDKDALYVNLFIPSTLTWQERGITLTQTTAFPNEDHTLFTINGKGNFDLKIRVPHWATNDFFVKINGNDQNVEAIPGSYLTLKRKWKNGDTIEVCMPFSFYLEPVMDQQNIASLFYGPVLLAAQEKEPRTDWRKLTLNAKDISTSISGDPEKLEFTLDGTVLKPFYETYGRYSVYFDVTLK